MRTTVKSLLMASAVVGAAFGCATEAFADAAPATPPSDWTITGSAGLATQYRFRGVAQSDNKPVIQGALTISHSSGFYISTWGSSATNPTDVTTPSGFESPVNIGGTEIDVYGGWTHGLGKSGVTFDGGFYGYIYPGATTGNYWEIYGSLTDTLGPVTGKIGANFAPAQKVFNYNWAVPSRSNAYIYGELGGAIPHTPLSIHTHLGHTGGGFDFPKEFLDYNVGVTYKWKSLAFDVALVGTNVSRSDWSNSALTQVPVEDLVATTTSSSLVEYFYRTTKPVAVVSISASF